VTAEKAAHEPVPSDKAVRDLGQLEFILRVVEEIVALFIEQGLVAVHA